MDKTEYRILIQLSKQFKPKPNQNIEFVCADPDDKRMSIFASYISYDQYTSMLKQGGLLNWRCPYTKKIGTFDNEWMEWMLFRNTYLNGSKVADKFDYIFMCALIKKINKHEYSDQIISDMLFDLSNKNMYRVSHLATKYYNKWNNTEIQNITINETI